jgi:hypothetical protein
MPDDQFSDKEFREFRNLLQDLALQAYPNPTRQNCPTTHVLAEMAALPLPAQHASYDHVAHCSPCLKDLIEERTRVLRNRRHRRRWTIVGVAAIVLISTAAVLLWIRGRVPVGSLRTAQRNSIPGNPPDAYEPASLNLRTRSVLRGSGVDREQPLQLPRKRVDVKIFLPFGSEAGTYDVMVLRQVDQPIIRTSGFASIQDGATILQTKIDLASLRAGHYLLGIRQSSWDWTYFPLTLP